MWCALRERLCRENTCAGRPFRSRKHKHSSEVYRKVRQRCSAAGPSEAGNSRLDPARPNLFLALQDTDATLHHFLERGEWKHQRRTPEQWTKWAQAGAASKAVTDHPDLGTEHRAGPLTYEVEVYQGCVRYKRGCKFCIEPKKGVPIWRTPEDIINEVRIAHDAGVHHVRLGGMTDTYTYMAEGVRELEYPVPNPEPIATLLHGLREDDRLGILHTDNGNPSIIAENLEPSEEITKTLVETLSDGAVLSFGLESADPSVHEANWLNCDPAQLKTAIRLVNKHGSVRGERGLPKLLPGLNFIAGLNGESEATYGMNMDLLRGIRSEVCFSAASTSGRWRAKVSRGSLRSLRSLQDGLQGRNRQAAFGGFVPAGQVIHDIHWESRRSNTPTGSRNRTPSRLGGSRQSRHHLWTANRRYPILVGVEYKIPLETQSSVITGHGNAPSPAWRSGSTR